MQTTLLGIGIAIILALIAALVGPHVVDWRCIARCSSAKASCLVGAPTRIDGAIEVRLLPVPGVTFRDVRVAGSAPDARLSAREVGVEFALGPLVRGEWRVTDMRIVAPEIQAGVDSKGQFAWAGNVPSSQSDALSIDQLSIQDGRSSSPTRRARPARASNISRSAETCDRWRARLAARADLSSADSATPIV